MKRIYSIILSLTILLTSAGTMSAQEKMLDDFSSNPGSRWVFFADTVMGGVSSGQVEFRDEAGQNYARLSGTVSTDNNGGFIQIQRQIGSAPLEASIGLKLTVRGNNQTYYIHLRTNGTRLPWQYYQAEFQVTENWDEITIPFRSFNPSGGFLRKNLKASSLKSIGLVAFGRDHSARVDIKDIKFY
jgi:hypothetical protein